MLYIIGTSMDSLVTACTARLEPWRPLASHYSEVVQSWSTQPGLIMQALCET